MQYSDGLVINPNLKYDKPINVISGGSKYADTQYPASSGRYKKVKAQYRDIPYNSGNQSTQSQIQEYQMRKRKMTGGAQMEKEATLPIAIQPRKFYATYNNDYMYKR